MHFLKRMLTLLIYFGYNSVIRQAKHRIQRKYHAETAWRMIRLGLIVFGVMLCFIALMEIIQAYQVLRRYIRQSDICFADYRRRIGLAGGLLLEDHRISPSGAGDPRIEDFDKAMVRQRSIVVLSRYLNV